MTSNASAKELQLLTQRLTMMPRALQSTAAELSVVLGSCTEQEIMFCSLLDARALKALVKEASVMSVEDRRHYLELLGGFANSVSDQAHGSSTQRRNFVSLCAAVVPFLHLVSEHGPNRREIEPLLRQNYTSSAIGRFQSRNIPGAKGTVRELISTNRASPDESSRYCVAGLFIDNALKADIAIEDAEWFARNWDAVSTVWDHLKAEQVYTRDYAELLIDGAKEHGPLFSDGML